MARTRSENYDGIHLGILTNAARLFSAQGYMRASIADLADACKLSRGALYHYFDSKEAILFAILDAHIREMIQHVETAVAAGGPTLTQFQNVIRAIVEVNAKSPHEQRVLIHDLSFLNEDEQRAIKDLERQLVDIVTDLLVRLDAEGRDRQAHQEDLHDDPVRHHQLHLHLVRSQGRGSARRNSPTWRSNCSCTGLRRVRLTKSAISEQACEGLRLRPQIVMQLSRSGQGSQFDRLIEATRGR